MDTKFDRIAKVAKEKPDEKLTSLIHLINKETLIGCHNKMALNKAAGVDGETKAKYNENIEDNLDKLLLRMKNQSYKPQPVKRTYIPKGKDGVRPLGIPAYEDKLVQSATANILTAIYEQDFLECSFGYRPNRSAHDALALLSKIVNKPKIEYVVDTDIKGFFDNMSHEWLVKFLEHRISDKNLIRLIQRMLKAGVTENGIKTPTKVGAPQGGSISPILANIYLHYVLDIWFEKIVRKRCKGKAYMVRFADDGVFCFEKDEESRKFYDELILRLDKFGLEVSKEKTKIVRLTKDDKDDDGNKPTFDFLGFTHYIGKSKIGKYEVTRRTSQKKFTQSLKNCKEWMKNNRILPVKVFMKELNRKLVGYCNYYAVTGNSTKLRDYLDKCRSLIFKWLNRRSQKRSFNWDKYVIFLKKYPLPKGTIKVHLWKMTKGLSYLSE
ncbi:MAG: group II intron reverse transcriptase/maturase [Cyclobacteriaceae bacterium]